MTCRNPQGEALDPEALHEYGPVSVWNRSARCCVQPDRSDFRGRRISEDAVSVVQVDLDALRTMAYRVFGESDVVYELKPGDATSAPLRASTDSMLQQA